MQRQFRLRLRRDFHQLREQGQSWSYPELLVSVLPNQLTHNRYGFVVGKKLGNAVKRNRVRRRLREIIRSLHIHLKPGYDVVIVARPASRDRTYWELRNTLQKLLRRARLES